MSKVRKVAYLPEKVSKEMEENAKEFSSESAYIVEAIRQLNKKQSKK